MTSKREAEALRRFHALADSLGMKPMQMTEEDEKEIVSYERLQAKINAKKGNI